MSLVVATLIVASIPALLVLVVALLAVLRIATVTPLGCLVIVVLICRLIETPSVWLERLAGLERLCARLERVCARAERALLRSAVEVHLLSLSREVILLGGRIIFPRVEVRHGCSGTAGEFCLAGSKMCCRDVGRLGLEAGGFIAGSLRDGTC
jgi:hypothetical protein